ncbi:hypothetical protein ACVRZA_05470 [Streptococcus halotolerans]
MEVDNVARYGKVSKLVGGDKIERTLVEIPGHYKPREGTFEYIIEPDGLIRHRFFNPNNIKR